LSLDHLGAHADDVADLRVGQASTAQVDHRRRTQTVQRAALQFRNRVACFGELNGVAFLDSSGILKKSDHRNML